MQNTATMRWILVVPAALLIMAQADDNVLNQLNGDQIVTLMQTFGDKCPPPPNNLSWAPIPESISCKDTPRCDFPKQWCAYKPAADGTPDLQTLSCQPLSEECKNAFDQANNDSSLVPPPISTPPPENPEGGSSPPPEASPPPEGSSPQTPPTEATPPPAASTPQPSQGTSPKPQGSSPQPQGSSTPHDRLYLYQHNVSSTPQSSQGSSPQPPAPSSTPQPGGGSTQGVGTSPAPPTQASIETPATSPGPQGTNATTIIPPFGECCDYHEFCCFWASLGQCQANKLFMVQLCQSSCGSCGCTKTDLEGCNLNIAAACANGNVTSTAVCKCKSTDLVNRDWHRSCPQWAANGGCDKNAAFMKPMCKKSCNVCQ